MRLCVETCHFPGLLSLLLSLLPMYTYFHATKNIANDIRAREDELLYVLRKLLELRLWPGTLWAALSESPSTHCLQQPGAFPVLMTLTQLRFSHLR